MKDKKRILFVTHSATRTGAPLILLNFMKWLRTNHPEVDFDVLFYEGGILEKEFSSLSSKSYFTHNPVVRFLDKHKLWGKNRHKFLKYVDFLSAYRRNDHRKYDCIYVNSLACSSIVPYLAKSASCPLICHVHELESVVEFFCKKEAVEAALPFFEKFIAVSGLVRNYLISDLRVEPKKIHKIPEFIRTELNIPNTNECRRKLNIDEDTFVICGSGTIDWRKGTDLFLQVASLVNKRINSKILFLWIGGDLDSRFFKEILFDRKKLNIQTIVQFTGNVEEPWLYYGASDLFALTSREDPFPLVALEAASLGLPIICFKNAVGSTEFVNDNTGSVVLFLDVHQFAEEIIHFIKNPVRLQKSSINIKLTSRNYASDPICQQIYYFIKNFM